MANPTHKLYVDESGTKEYSATYGRGCTRYFVFAGLLITPAEAGRLAAELKALKRSHLGTDAVEVKANWLKRPVERQRRYLQPLNLRDPALDEFINEVYRMLAGLDGELIAALVDKVEVCELYREPWYAPAIAYECLMQRAHLAMVEAGGTVSVTVDDMSGATPKGSQYKENLSRHHRRLKSSGSQLIVGMQMDRLADIGFSDSQSDERLQLADLVAYAVYRQFVEHGPAWDGPDGTLPLYPYLGRVWRKFRRGPNDIVAGYGIVKFPRKTWKGWAAKKKP